MTTIPIPATGRFDLTDAQWAILDHCSRPAPSRAARPRGPNASSSTGSDGEPGSGAPWRDVPACYGTWQTIYGLFRRWQRDGTWTRILTRLQARADAAGLICWDVSVDTTIARAHQHAAGARKKGTSRPNHPAASAHPNQPTTGWAARGVG